MVIGVGIILLLGDSPKQFVFGVQPRSVAVLIGVSVGMSFVAMIATVPTAVRAMRVDVRNSVG